MKLKFVSVTLFSCVIGFLSLNAQTDTLKLSLQEVFSLADKNNKDLKILSSQLENSAEDLRASKRQLLPEISAKASVSFLSDGLISDRDFTGFQTVDIPHFGNSFSLQVGQMIYSGGALSSAVNMSELGREISLTSFDKAKSSIRFLVAGYYLDIFTIDNRIKIYEKNISLTDELIKQTKARQTQGDALENDVLRYELQKADYELALQRLESNRRILNNKLNIAVGLKENSFIETDSSFFLMSEGIKDVSFYQNEAKTSAFANRLAQSEYLLAQEEMKISQSADLPKVYAFAQGTFDGPITMEIPAIDKNFAYWFAGVGISYDISQIYRNKPKKQMAKNKLYRQQINKQQTEENINAAVTEEYIRYTQSLREVSVLEKRVALSEKNYRTVLVRYNNGLALVTDMLDAANNLLSAELEQTNAKVNVLFSYFRLLCTCGEILD
ncbi:MAG: TolC family protein [Bacteroidales bacterium]|nr:TolC family protein [Bacteroidales bacterium]